MPCHYNMYKNQEWSTCTCSMLDTDSFCSVSRQILHVKLSAWGWCCIRALGALGVQVVGAPLSSWLRASLSKCICYCCPLSVPWTCLSLGCCILFWWGVYTCGSCFTLEYRAWDRAQWMVAFWSNHLIAAVSWSHYEEAQLRLCQTTVVVVNYFSTAVQLSENTLPCVLGFVLKRVSKEWRQFLYVCKSLHVAAWRGCC